MRDYMDIFNEALQRHQADVARDPEYQPWRDYEPRWACCTWCESDLRADGLCPACDDPAGGG